MTRNQLGLAASFCVGLLAGMRAMSAPAVASRVIESQSANTPALPKAPRIAATLMAGEMLADKLPILPDRRKPPSFAWRVASGAVSGAVVGKSRSGLIAAALLGSAGAIAGTLGGATLRSTLANAFGRDLPAALIEDAMVATVALLVLQALRHGPENAPVIAFPSGLPVQQP